MWDYRDEEFCFADGWLVLRGPNGSGKTKALEVLFPFVLDGRIDPKRLNPFAAEDHTVDPQLPFRGGDTAEPHAGRAGRQPRPDRPAPARNPLPAPRRQRNAVPPHSRRAR